MPIVERCGPNDARLRRCGGANFRRRECFGIKVGVRLSWPQLRSSGVETDCNNLNCAPSGGRWVSNEPHLEDFLFLRSSAITLTQFSDALISGEAPLVTTPLGTYRSLLRTGGGNLGCDRHLVPSVVYVGSQRWVRFEARGYFCIPCLSLGPAGLYSNWLNVECCGDPWPFNCPPPKYALCEGYPALFPNVPPFGYTYSTPEPPLNYETVIGKGLIDYGEVFLRVEVQTDQPWSAIPTKWASQFGLWLQNTPSSRRKITYTCSFPPLQLAFPTDIDAFCAGVNDRMEVLDIPPYVVDVAWDGIYASGGFIGFHEIWGKINNSCCCNNGDNDYKERVISWRRTFGEWVDLQWV